MIDNAARRAVCAAVLVVLTTEAAACSSRGPDRTDQQDSMETKQPIQVVLQAHTDSLMRLPGVVGTAIGLCDQTPCIKILAARVTPELRRSAPTTLEGYRVIIEETGLIRAQDSTGR